VYEITFSRMRLDQLTSRVLADSAPVGQRLAHAGQAAGVGDGPDRAISLACAALLSDSP
jgi:hypothetical protein